MREGVVISGLGCVSAFGTGHALFGDALFDGRCGVRPIDAFQTTDCVSHQAAMLGAFDPAEFVAPKLLRRVDQAGRLALACAKLALQDAGGAPGADGTDEMGVALGSLSAGVDSTVDYLRGLAQHGPAGVPAMLFSNTVSNAAASLCAIEHGLRGPNVTFSQREASSLCALAFSVGAIRMRRTKAMLAGSVDRLEETFFKVHDQFHALSPMQSGGVEGARPFDRRRNGFVLGEGGYLVVLESMASARERGARVHGEILGIGMTASPCGLNRWPADPSGLARAIRLALSDAELPPSAVDAVYATANGSPHLDCLEARALTTVFGDRPIPVASLKGAIGENSGGGVASVIAAVLTLRRGAVIPTVGFHDPDAACPVNVSPARRAVSGATFLVNSVGSGGANYAAIIRC